MSLNFHKLWSSYPKDQFPCSGGWANQCAIRVSIALEGAGFSLSGFAGPNVCGHGHVRGAESLADHLWVHLFYCQKFSGGSGALKKISGRTGIVFFRNLTGFRGGQGDHIDLWDGSYTKTGEYAASCQELWFWRID